MPLIGYWIESVYDDRFLAPQEVADQLPPEAASKVLAYLQAGKHYRRACGLSWCRFSGIYLGSDELTDGYWIWPDGLIHYVAEHRVGLPEAFLADILHGRSQIDNTAPDPSLDFWLEWCQHNQDPSFRKKLRLTREQTEKLAKAAFKDYVHAKRARLNAEYGVGHRICLQANCHELTLAGKVFCAEYFESIPSIEDGRRAVDNPMPLSLLLTFLN
ncbi:hypothetical protein BST81_17065 [Leptolyngbya sp. 'hensonii']|uniref:hypothetical protein n=1 Tax=Leptolyngbya sp. 'hensonii' TaxID=1922337 RepID=UPI00094F5CD0|nr:hypothetical protein [Leptolyngbya sp. 'hensonii']OLP17069.1 hypothetical protein BST81_17065 [Leptolyngbya sp. 'hensonii']